MSSHLIQIWQWQCVIFFRVLGKDQEWVRQRTSCFTLPVAITDIQEEGKARLEV